MYNSVNTNCWLIWVYLYPRIFQFFQFFQSHSTETPPPYRVDQRSWIVFFLYITQRLFFVLLSFLMAEFLWYMRFCDEMNVFFFSSLVTLPNFNFSPHCIAIVCVTASEKLIIPKGRCDYRKGRKEGVGFVLYSKKYTLYSTFTWTVISRKKKRTSETDLYLWEMKDTIFPDIMKLIMLQMMNDVRICVVCVVWITDLPRKENH